MHKPVNQVERGGLNDFAQIVEAYGDLVMTVCIKIIGDKVLAEEAVQDTFMKTYKSLQDFRAESSLKTWIYRIAYRTAIDYARKKRRESVINPLDEANAFVADAGTLEELSHGEQMAWIHRGIAALPPEQAAIISIYYLEEKNIREVCEITGLKESNVKIKLHRARKSLKQILSDTKSIY